MATHGQALLDRSAVTEAFSLAKGKTDDMIVRNNLDTYCEEFLPRTDDLTVAIIVQAFEGLGCKVRSSPPGTTLSKVEYEPQYVKLVEWMHKVLENKAGLIRSDETRPGTVVRTDVPLPDMDIDQMLEDLLDDRPGQSLELQIISIVGPAYADCLSGRTDAVKLLFGTDHGRALLSDFYSKSDLFNVVLNQLELFFESLCRAWGSKAAPLRILEVGAGTGGTTWRVLAVLKRMKVKFVYTMTDIGSAFGAAAQSRLAQYDGAEFRVLDIEKEPPTDLHHTQHVVLGSNVLHATRNLEKSLTHVKKILLRGGIVLLHELTQQMLWGDMSFGLFPGWWAFEDQRDNAIQGPEAWEQVMELVGMDHVDHTSGSRPEAGVQAVILGISPSRAQCT